MSHGLELQLLLILLVIKCASNFFRLRSGGPRGRYQQIRLDGRALVLIAAEDVSSSSKPIEHADEAPGSGPTTAHFTPKEIHARIGQLLC